MKIVVIGGTGLIGSKTVAILRQGGHEVVAASPNSGVNSITGEGLKEAMAGAQVVIDLANSPSFEDNAVLEFFETSGRNLLAAEAAAGVGHHIALSIVGTDRTPDNGYGTPCSSATAIGRRRTSSSGSSRPSRRSRTWNMRWSTPRSSRFTATARAPVLLRRNLCADAGLRIAAQGHRQEKEAARRGARRTGRALQTRAAAPDRDARGFPLCEMLKIPFASPVAKMSRRLVDGKGNVLYAGATWYRGDRYVSEIDFPVSALRTVPGITEPQVQAVGERKRG